MPDSSFTVAGTATAQGLRKHLSVTAAKKVAVEASRMAFGGALSAMNTPGASVMDAPSPSKRTSMFQ